MITGMGFFKGLEFNSGVQHLGGERSLETSLGGLHPCGDVPIQSHSCRGFEVKQRRCRG